jgi:hypothetical protein
LLVYDAPPPSNIEAINLTVVSVDVVAQDGRIINVSDKPQVFNLLDYREGNPLELVNKVIPSGRYSQIRLKLNEDNSIVVSGVTKSLKTPSAQQSGVKLTGNFEITEGLLYTMRLHFDPNESIVYNPGPDRYILKPVIEITGNSLVDGPFSVTGLIESETVVAEFRPDGTLRMIGTFDPRIELRGKYYFNYGTRVLHLELSEVFCSTCSGVTPLPSDMFYNLPDSDVSVSKWTTTRIQGTIGTEPITRDVSFEKSNAFSLAFSGDYSVVHIAVSYPVGSSGKFGLVTLSPADGEGRSFIDIQKIQNQTATFVLKIPYRELPGGIPGGSRVYMATPIVADELSDLNISGQAGSVCGNVSLAATNYTMTVPVADKILNTNIVFIQ